MTMVPRWVLLLLALSSALVVAACASPDSRRAESLRRTEEAAANGDFDRAEEILRSAHGFDPRDQLIVARLARVYEESGAYQQALRLVEGFPEESYEPRWVNLRARLLMRCGRVREGGRLATSLARIGEAEEATFQTLSDVVVQRKAGPENVDGLPDSWVRRLAKRLLEGDEAAAALSWLERLPSAPDLEEDVLVRELAARALESEDRGFVSRIDSLVAEARSPLAGLVRRRRLVLEGRKADVARLDRQFLASFPDDPRRGEILESEGRRHLARGDLEGALKFADQALALDGSLVGALILRGLALEWSGRSEEGRAALRTALALEPDNRVAREALRPNQETQGTLLMRIEPLEP